VSDLISLCRLNANTYRWNVRIELSRPVYRELHRIPTLAHLHIRLQAGPSQYETPPPLPLPSLNDSQGFPPSNPPPFPNIPAIPNFPPLSFVSAPSGGPPPAHTIFAYAPPPHGPPPPPPAPKKDHPKAPKKAPSRNEPPTFSGFKKLKSLAVLDIDNLDIIPEIQACVRNCASTLTKLKLSFSDALASQSRKPVAENSPYDSSDTESEEEGFFQNSNNANSAAAKMAGALEEKKAQDAVLATIFDVEPLPDEKPAKKSQKREKDGVGSSKGKDKTKPDMAEFLKNAMAKYVEKVNGSGDVAIPQEVLDMLGKAAKKFMEEVKEGKNDKGKEEKNEEVKNEAESSKDASSKDSDSSSKKAPTSNIKKKPDIDPDDIDITAPDDELDLDSEHPANDDLPPEPSASEPSPSHTRPSKPQDPRLTQAIATQRETYRLLAQELSTVESQIRLLTSDISRWRANTSLVPPQTLADAEKRLQGFNDSVKVIKAELEACEKRLVTLQAQGMDGQEKGREKEKEKMSVYLRTTRGLALKSLGISLIPTRASVLSRAVDLRSLHKLTLLNVGNQAPIWALLQRENREAPLPLRKIFTDNVSPVFLGFLSELEAVEELFMLERAPSWKPASLAPKTTVGIGQIRRLVLRRHVGTLRRLMIRNAADTEWDVDEKTVVLLCRGGRRLEELAVKMSVGAMVGLPLAVLFAFETRC